MALSPISPSDGRSASDRRRHAMPSSGSPRVGAVCAVALHQRPDQPQQRLVLGVMHSPSEEIADLYIAHLATRSGVRHMPHEHAPGSGVSGEKPAISVRAGIKLSACIHTGSTPGEGYRSPTRSPNHRQRSETAQPPAAPGGCGHRIRRASTTSPNWSTRRRGGDRPGPGGRSLPPNPTLARLDLVSAPAGNRSFGPTLRTDTRMRVGSVILLATDCPTGTSRMSGERIALSDPRIRLLVRSANSEEA